MRKVLLLFIIAAVFGFVADISYCSQDATEENLSCFDLSEKYRSGISVEMIEKIKLPKGYHEGLFIKDGDIWVNNGMRINTWIISPSGELKGEIQPPATFTEGITDSSVPERYWVTDWDTRKLYRVKIEASAMVPDMEISLEPSLPTGVTRAGDKIYVMTWTRGWGTKYHLLRFDENGKMLAKVRMKNISEPSQITWDGSCLWITSWYSQKVYKVDPASFRVLGHFNSPAKDATGIAWDKGYFWITGTYDDLYRIKVGEK